MIGELIMNLYFARLRTLFSRVPAIHAPYWDIKSKVDRTQSIEEHYEAHNGYCGQFSKHYRHA